jgi:hypothetical protein
MGIPSFLDICEEGQHSITSFRRLRIRGFANRNMLPHILRGTAFVCSREEDVKRFRNVSIA